MLREFTIFQENWEAPQPVTWAIAYSAWRAIAYSPWWAIAYSPWWAFVAILVNRLFVSRLGHPGFHDWTM